tara:strand:- start:345 stop:638 length:294 start_codon:yes stop_codon:yes gene_type:complete
MNNAKKEFEEFFSNRSEIKCAEIQVRGVKADLKVGHDEEDYNNFLNLLDVKYDSGYGGQELYGIVWFEDGTWAQRGEYDGSEWWEHYEVPKIPEQLY